MTTAHAGYMKVVGIASTYSVSKLKAADAVIQNFEELWVEVREGRLMVAVGPGSRDSELSVRVASVSDCEALASLINSAFAIEKFLEGERTDPEQLKEMMRKGQFLLGCDAAGQLVASVYVEVRGSRGYFGMLAVHPEQQKNGLGSKMV